MQLMRMFTTEQVKGTRNYMDTQKKYELLRTLIYFAIPISLFVAGVVQTGDRANLLSIVAVLGLLPASKSLVSAIMFLRYHSLSDKAAGEIAGHSGDLKGLYDCVFTSYKKNFEVGYLAVRGKTVCGYSEDTGFAENEFYEHLDSHLKLDGHKDVTVKIFTDLKKFTGRLDQMCALKEDEEKTAAVLSTLKSVML